jgi:hypothetical protein
VAVVCHSQAESFGLEISSSIHRFPFWQCVSRNCALLQFCLVALTWTEVYIVSRARDQAAAAVPALALLEMLSTVIRAEADSEPRVRSRAAANADSERRTCARVAGYGAVGTDTDLERRTHFRGDGIFSSVPALVIMGGGLRRTGGSIVVGAFAGAGQRTRSLTVLDMKRCTGPHVPQDTAVDTDGYWARRRCYRGAQAFGGANGSLESCCPAIAQVDGDSSITF